VTSYLDIFLVHAGLPKRYTFLLNYPFRKPLQDDQVHASFAQVYCNPTPHSHLHSGASKRLFLLTMHRIHPLVFSASFFNPVSWVKEKFGPAVKETQSEEKIQAAKDQAKKEGTANLFEEVQTVTPPKLAPKDLQKRAAGSYKKKKKPDSVRTFVSSQMRF
jgi:hypothetical protein